MFDGLISFEELTEEAISLAQLKLLHQTVRHAKSHSAFYAERLKTFDSTHFSIEEFKQIPPTTKDDLNRNNAAFYAVEKDQIKEVTATSGTLGNPTEVPLTERDLARLAHNEYLALGITGITQIDVVQIATNLDPRFMAAKAYDLGVQKIGATVLKVGVKDPEKQWLTIRSSKTTVLIIVPSFFYKLLLYAQEKGIDFKKTELKKVVCIGEPIREEDFSLNTLGSKIKSIWPEIGLYSTYASTEMATAFTECEFGQGGHHLAELVFVEILDEANDSVNDGEYGELTITTLQSEAMPLIRFKTGDIVRLESLPCACGRKGYRLSSVLGRKQHQIKIKGTTIYPQAIFDICESFDVEYQIEVSKNSMGLDEVTVYVDSSLVLHNMVLQFKKKIHVTPTIMPVSKKTLRQKLWKNAPRKPIKFLDLRTFKYK